MKVGIIGVGKIGAAYAFALSRSGLAEELVLIDLDFELALAHAADLSYGLAASSCVQISAGHWRELADADLIVLAAGVRPRMGMRAVDLAVKNSSIFKAICAKLPFDTFSGVVVVASDPVDILTMATFQFSGLSRQRVVGVGTVATTIRLSQLIAQALAVNPQQLSILTAGVRGSYEFPLWSQARFGGAMLSDFANSNGLTLHDLDSLFSKAQKEVREIVRGKGGVCYAVVSALMRVSRAILCNEGSLLTVTTPLEDEYGCTQVSLGVPSLVGRGGSKILQFECSEEELTAFSTAASLQQGYMIS